jgi:hypothetical protein
MFETTGIGAALLSLLLLSGPVLAQSGGSGGHGMGPASAQKSTPAPRYGTDYTPGWSMMSKEERNAHRKHMHELKTYEDCRAYLERHREQMAPRAREQGRNALAPPRRDACAALKKP